MTVVFCGHSTYIEKNNDKKKVLEILEERVGENSCEFFLGEYGRFDFFAYDCAKAFKEKHPNAKLIFVTPYVIDQRGKEYASYKRKKFDMIIYPELERAPLRYAISHRNRWMIKQADIVISYIDHQYGGAYAMYRQAKAQNKELYNIAPSIIDF